MRRTHCSAVCSNVTHSTRRVGAAARAIWVSTLVLPIEGRAPMMPSVARSCPPPIARSSGGSPQATSRARSRPGSARSSYTPAASAAISPSDRPLSPKRSPACRKASRAWSSFIA